MLLRKNAPDSYKWDLTKIIKDDKEFDELFEKLVKLLEKFKDYKGKLNTEETILELLKFNSDYERMFDKIYVYNYLSLDTDLKNNKYLERKDKLENLVSSFQNETSFILPELSTLNNDFIIKLIQNDNFKDYKISLNNIIRNKKFILSEKEEKALATVSSFANGFSSIFDSINDSDLRFDAILINNKKFALTIESYSKYMENKDRKVRTQAYNNLYKSYKQFSKTISTNYIYSIKQNCSELKLRNEGSYLDSCLYAENLPKEIYYTLINNVNNNLPKIYKYFNLLKKNLKIKDFGFEDINLSISNKNSNKYSIAKQKEIIIKALSPLGADYLKEVDYLINNRQIDYLMDENKSSGGYSIGIYDAPPYILVNNNDNYNSLTTLIHELGHSMHSYYSNSNQPYTLSSYSIFIAEIASTTNEILLFRYLYKNSKSLKDKIFYLDNYIKTFKATVYRQTMFSEFEDFSYKKVENGETISLEILKDKYKELLKKYFGTTTKIDNNIIYEWLRIPHFYSPYYVYKYATSFIASNFIASSIINNKENALNNYKTLLKSGGSDYPYYLLKNAGIDLAKDDIYIQGFNDLEKAIKELKSLLKKID
jgi:oligoendopeptidase F